MLKPHNLSRQGLRRGWACHVWPRSPGSGSGSLPLPRLHTQISHRRHHHHGIIGASSSSPYPYSYLRKPLLAPSSLSSSSSSSSSSLSFPRPRSILPMPTPTTTQHRRTHTPSPPSASASTSTSTPSPLPSPTPYTPPTTGLLSHLPRAWIPYAELLRINSPTGTYYLLFPCIYSTLLSAPLTSPPTPPLTILGTTLLFSAGAFIMRGAGCAINDLWDRNLDPRVTRTRLRPLARGALTPFRALTFVGGNLLLGLGILLQFPAVCLLYGVPSLVLVASYPLAKRVTYYPQFVLGLTFSWGALMGFPALGVDFLGLAAAAAPLAEAVLGSHGAAALGLDAASAAAYTSGSVSVSGSGGGGETNALAAASLLYLSNVSWTVLYDMIYAHMDIRDDSAAGIKSIALAHPTADKTRRVLALLALTQVSLLAGAGVAAGSGPAFFVGSCGGAAVSLAWMISRVRLEDVRDCWWWFVNGCWITGGLVAGGLGVDYVVRYLEVTKEEGEGGDAE